MAKKKTRNEELVDALRMKGLRKRVAQVIADGAGTTKGNRVARDLRSAASMIEDRVSGKDARRKAAAKKAAATRKRKAAKRSTAAKKGAATRAKAKR